MTGQPFAPPPDWLFIVFPFLFVGMWLTITTILGLLSGWFMLQGRYPRGGEEPLERRRIGSASMGLGVHFRRIITLAACPSGLRVSANRIMAPFQRPFLVPWNEISAEEGRSFFVPVTRLRFGRPEVGKLTVGTKDWERLVIHADPQSMRSGNLAVEPVSGRSIGAALLLQWVIMVALAGTFFFLASRQPEGPRLPALLCYGFPAAVFGIGQFIRWIGQLR